MAKLTLDDLRKLREAKHKELKKRESDKESQIIIGMSTCGIAAGAKEAMNAFVDEIEKLGLDNVLVKQTSCMGYCANEPTVEVKTPEMQDTLYGNVSPEVARQIVRDHLVHKKLVSEHVFDKPSVDIIEQA